MQTDVKGRLKNISLPHYRCLLPLYEAVINAFQSIEDTSKPQDRYIKIKVLRNTSQARMNIEGVNEDIEGFVVEDNGPGFNDNNLNSFLTSDSTFKASKGGKGIGRFLWLKAFDKVEIASHFSHDNKIHNRLFGPR